MFWFCYERLFVAVREAKITSDGSFFVCGDELSFVDTIWKLQESGCFCFEVHA